jgi:hypothetical protein
MNNWNKKDIWTRRSSNFLVEISRHSTESINDMYGTNMWCVYAYIYKSHPHFDKFDGCRMFQDAACSLPLHAGPSFLKYHRNNDGIITCVQVGADYNHLHDDNYTYYLDEKDAISVFEDADNLFDWLENYK